MMVWVAGGLAALLPLLVVDALFYESAANARDCFYLIAEKGEEIVGSYETFFGENVLRVTLDMLDEILPGEDRTASAAAAAAASAAGGGGVVAKQLFHSLKEADHFQVVAPRKARYALCLRNLLSYEHVITFNARVQKATHETHPQDLATVDQTDKLNDLSALLSGKVEDISNQQSHAITREAIHRSTSESTNSRVLWWTIFQVAALVVLSTLQVCYMRSFFEVKTIV